MTARHSAARRHHRFQAPRLLLLFGAVLVGTAVALVWLGWRLVRQDRLLERQYLQQHLETTGERLGALLAGQLVHNLRHLAVWVAARAFLHTLHDDSRKHPY